MFPKKEITDVMKAMFSGKLKDMYSPKYKIVELGQGFGIGQYGLYDKYIKKLSKQQSKGTINIGKSIELKNNVPYLTDITDKLYLGDIPKILITLHNIINDVSIDTIWKTSNDSIILEQHYDIPSPYSMQYDWWDIYTVYFIGPENLKVGTYKVLILLDELSLENVKKSTGELTFEMLHSHKLSSNQPSSDQLSSDQLSSDQSDKSDKKEEQIEITTQKDNKDNDTTK